MWQSEHNFHGSPNLMVIRFQWRLYSFTVRLFSCAFQNRYYEGGDGSQGLDLASDLSLTKHSSTELLLICSSAHKQG